MPDWATRATFFLVSNLTGGERSGCFDHCFLCSRIRKNCTITQQIMKLWNCEFTLTGFLLAHVVTYNHYSTVKFPCELRPFSLLCPNCRKSSKLYRFSPVFCEILWVLLCIYFLLLGCEEDYFISSLGCLENTSQRCWQIRMHYRQRSHSLQLPVPADLHHEKHAAIAVHRLVVGRS